MQIISPFFLYFPCFPTLNISAFVFVFFFSWQRIRLRGKTQLTWHLSDYTKDTVAKDLIFSENNTSVVFHYSFSTSRIFQYKYMTPWIFYYHCSIYKSNKGWNMRGSVYSIKVKVINKNVHNRGKKWMWSQRSAIWRDSWKNMILGLRM